MSHLLKYLASTSLCLSICQSVCLYHLFIHPSNYPTTSIISNVEAILRDSVKLLSEQNRENTAYDSCLELEILHSVR